MNIIYTLSIIVLTLFINASVTWAMPHLKTKYKAFITRIKRVLTRKPNQTIDATALVALTQRIEEIEKRLEKRQENYRKAIREEIKNVLIELKNQ